VDLDYTYATPSTLSSVDGVASLSLSTSGGDRTQRGIGKLLEVFRDESLRLRRPVTDPALRAWLAEFRGSSAAARTARALLADD